MSRPALSIPAGCSCGSIGRSDLRRCDVDDHHRYWLGDRELASVSTVIRAAWPVRSGFLDAKPDVLAHARERGIRVDRYLSEYVHGGRVTIPKGEWKEVRALVQKGASWWSLARQIEPNIQSQVIVHDGTVAGTLDFLVGRHSIVDLKATYDLELSYKVQVGAYADLYEDMTGDGIDALGILQVTERLAQARFVGLDVDECKDAWRKVRAVWDLMRRWTGGAQ